MIAKCFFEINQKYDKEKLLLYLIFNAHFKFSRFLMQNTSPSLAVPYKILDILCFYNKCLQIICSSIMFSILLSSCGFLHLRCLYTSRKEKAKHETFEIRNKTKIYTFTCSKKGYCSSNVANMAAVVWKSVGQMKTNQTCFDPANLYILFIILIQTKYC